MDTRKKIKIILICTAILALIGSIALSAYLFFSNYRNVKLFRRAESNFRQGDAESIKLAESQLLALVNSDPDNEQAYILLAQIAKQKKIHPERVFFSLQAHKLNPLSLENENTYIDSLLYIRDFSRLENFLSLKSDLNGEQHGLLLYAAGQNGNIGKYRTQLNRRNDNLIAELALLLYKYTHLDIKHKLQVLDNYLANRAKNDFHKQEILAAMTTIHLAQGDIDNAEKCLLQAYKLNEFAFAPALGRFYMNYRSIGKAKDVFEKHLAVYHDPVIALQTAEIYCLLKKNDKIKALLKHFQGDTGKDAMLLCYYFEVLDSFAGNNIDACRKYLAPLQEAVNTPLATFIYLCVELDSKKLSAVYKYYDALLNQRTFNDLKLRADQLIVDLIKNSSTQSLASNPMLLSLAEKVYPRKQDVMVGKFLLLSQRKNGKLNVSLLNDLLKNFPNDMGVNKIAIEYYLKNDLVAAEKHINKYMQISPNNKADMLKYRIILAVRQNNSDKASLLFKENFSDDIAEEYWNFAISRKRTDDLRFLAKDSLYKPFCEAAILLANGKKAQALDILYKADAKNNQNLLFYAAQTLAEHDRLKEALELYGKFPENSAYKLDVLMNISELYLAAGNQLEAVNFAKKSYLLAPKLSVTQFCYADKLYKSGRLSEIADIVILAQSSPYYEKLRQFLIASLEFKLKKSDPVKERDKISGMSDRLLRIAPNNKIAQKYRKEMQNFRK